MVCVLLVISAFALANIGEGLAPACHGTQEPGHRQCYTLHENVNTSNDCRQLCCASSAASPVPYPGIVSPGCVAWSAAIRTDSQGQTHGQCGMCVGTHDGRPIPVPPVNTSACPTGDVCTTGMVDATVAPLPPAPPAIIPQIGAEAGPDYVNVMHDAKVIPVYANGSNIHLNRTTEMTKEGWPLMDCQITVFDARPTHAWAPPMDDPEHRQADFSGVWTIMLTGNATIELVQAVGITLGSPSYDEDTNTLTQELTFAKGSYPKVQNLLILRFTNTRALPSSPAAVNGTGFTDLRIIKPGYSDKPTQIFTDNWASLNSIFSRLRWMGATGTNSYGWRCGPPNAASCSVVQWAERRTPGHLYSTDPNLPKGAMPWEFVLLAANELNSDVWINVPLTASSPHICRTDPNGDHTKCLHDDPKSTYEYQLALLFRDGNNFTGNVGLKKNLKIYVEHSNEVWNFGFKQHSMNVNFAEWEVLNTTNSNLDKPVPGHPDIEDRQHCTNKTAPPSKSGGSGSPVGSMCWSRRRHARRVYEISQTFQEVFGPGSLNNRVRMVYASWGLPNNIQTYFNDTLYWLQAEYGDVNKFIYAISYAQYFGPHSQNQAGGNPFNYSTATIPEVLDGFHNATIEGILMTTELVKLAKAFGVQTASYEGGPGYRVGGEKPGSKGLNTMITAARDPGMKAIVKEHVDLCFRFGWDLYQYFSAEGEYSEYGCWGATETYGDLKPGPPKLQALYELTGHHPALQQAWARNGSRARTMYDSHAGMYSLH